MTREKETQRIGERLAKVFEQEKKAIEIEWLRKTNKNHRKNEERNCKGKWNAAKIAK